MTNNKSNNYKNNNNRKKLTYTQQNFYGRIVYEWRAIAKIMRSWNVSRKKNYPSEKRKPFNVTSNCSEIMKASPYDICDFAWRELPITCDKTKFFPIMSFESLHLNTSESARGTSRQVNSRRTVQKD